MLISSLRPPTSSYVTSSIFSSVTSVASGLNTTSVFSVMMTPLSLGEMSTTMNLMSEKPMPPIIPSSRMLLKMSPKGERDMVLRRVLIPPRETRSPLTTTRPRSPCLNIPEGARTMMPLPAGAMMTLLASLTSALRMRTISPMPVFEFLLVMPSILTMWSPMSPG